MHSAISYLAKHLTLEQGEPIILGTCPEVTLRRRCVAISSGCNARKTPLKAGFCDMNCGMYLSTDNLSPEGKFVKQNWSRRYFHHTLLTPTVPPRMNRGVPFQSTADVSRGVRGYRRQSAAPLTLRALRDEGVRGEMRTSALQSSARAWTTLTGSDAAKGCRPVRKITR